MNPNPWHSAVQRFKPWLPPSPAALTSSRAIALALALTVSLPSLAHAQQPASSTGTPAPAATPAAAPTPAATSSSKNLAPGFAGLAVADKVALLPMDVELFELGVGGVTEPKAEWTASASALMKQAIIEKNQALKLSLVEVSEKEADDYAELLGLQAAVARSIAIHHFNAQMLALPTKAGALSWNLGEAMKPLADKTGAQYGLFVWVRDYYSSPGRVAMGVVLAFAGVALHSAPQLGLATLVDLKTGQVVWMNRSTSMSDLRRADSAKGNVEQLLSQFPAVN
jgi:hypothetical protein